MAKELKAPSGDEFRLMCPVCESTWSTLSVPFECDCGAVVTFRVVRRGNEQKGDQG